MSGAVEIQIVQRPHESLQAEVDRVIQLRITEIMQRKDLASFHPFFESKRLSDELRRQQTAVDWHKWAIYYEMWGCSSCGVRELRHHAHGMCKRCFERMAYRLGIITRRLIRNCERAEKFLDQETSAYRSNRPKLKGLPAHRPKGRPTVLPGESGEREKRLREVTGMSQADLAAAAGVDASTINHFERGRCRPLPANCDAIKRVLAEGLIKAFWP